MKRKPTHLSLGYAPTAISIVVLLVLTLSPHAPQIRLPLNWADKIEHFVAMGGLICVMMTDASRAGHRLTLPLVLKMALGVSALGGLIEVLQDAMGWGRFGEWADFVADTLGALVFGLLLYRPIQWAVRLVLSKCLQNKIRR